MTTRRADFSTIQTRTHGTVTIPTGWQVFGDSLSPKWIAEHWASRRRFVGSLEHVVTMMLRAAA
jgi:hypothetical protein